MVRFAARAEVPKVVAESYPFGMIDGVDLGDQGGEEMDRILAEHDGKAVQAKVETWRSQGYGYWLLVVAGLGIFCGCVGKSASSRCTSGCPTPWKAPRPSAP